MPKLITASLSSVFEMFISDTYLNEQTALSPLQKSAFRRHLRSVTVTKSFTKNAGTSF